MRAQNTEQVEEGNLAELWSAVAELLTVYSVTFEGCVQCDEATRTSAELTTKHAALRKDKESSEDGMNDNVMDYESATIANDDCDKSATLNNALDIRSAYSRKTSTQGMKQSTGMRLSWSFSPYKDRAAHIRKRKWPSTSNKSILSMIIRILVK